LGAFSCGEGDIVAILPVFFLEIFEKYLRFFYVFLNFRIFYINVFKKIFLIFTLRFPE